MNELLSGRRLAAHVEDHIDLERRAFGGFGPFERDWLLSKKTTKQSLRDLIAHVNAGRMQVRDGKIVCAVGGVTSPFTSVEGQPSAAPASFTPVASTTSETNLWVPAIWTPIPANSMMAGKVYKVEFGGILSTSSAAPGSIWTPRVGQSATPSSNVTLGATTNTTLIASLVNVPFYGILVVVIRSLGLAASGATATGNGYVTMGGLTTAAGIIQVYGGTVAATVDNTAATGLILSNTWGSSHANDTVTAQWAAPVLSLN